MNNDDGSGSGSGSGVESDGECNRLREATGRQWQTGKGVLIQPTNCKLLSILHYRFDRLCVVCLCLVSV